MNIGVIGLGYVGITFAAAALMKGHQIFGIEVNQHIKDCLADNRAHFFEPGLNEILQGNNSNLHISNKFSSKKVFDAFVITVGTPLKDGTTMPNFEYIKSSLETLREVYDGSQLVILRSTVSVGTTRKIVLPFLANLCGKSEQEILVAMCPERTVEGNAVNELIELPQIVSGNNSKSLVLAKKLFLTMTSKVIEASSLEEAELIKLYCNTYRDMMFAIGNAFVIAAQTFGVDGGEAVKKANEGYRRCNISQAGFVAGPCLEKDAYILTNNMQDEEVKKFILQARKYNENLIDKVIEWVKLTIGKPAKDKIIAVSGLAFKGNPETSDLRGSAAVKIIRRLSDEGYNLRLHDFKADKKEIEALGCGAVYDDVATLVDNACLLMILNNNRSYGKLEAKIFEKQRQSFKILDIWGVASNLLQDETVDVVTINNMFMRNK